MQFHHILQESRGWRTCWHISTRWLSQHFYNVTTLQHCLSKSGKRLKWRALRLVLSRSTRSLNTSEQTPKNLTMSCHENVTRGSSTRIAYTLHVSWHAFDHNSIHLFVMASVWFQHSNQLNWKFCERSRNRCKHLSYNSQSAYKMPKWIAFQLKMPQGRCVGWQQWQRNGQTVSNWNISSSMARSRQRKLLGKSVSEKSSSGILKMQIEEDATFSGMVPSSEGS